MKNLFNHYLTPVEKYDLVVKSLTALEALVDE